MHPRCVWAKKQNSPSFGSFLSFHEQSFNIIVWLNLIVQVLVMSHRFFYLNPFLFSLFATMRGVVRCLLELAV